jgi:hypothetical protein
MEFGETGPPHQMEFDEPGAKSSSRPRDQKSSVLSYSRQYFKRAYVIESTTGTLSNPSYQRRGWNLVKQDFHTRWNLMQQVRSLVSRPKVLGVELFETKLQEGL